MEPTPPPPYHSPKKLSSFFVVVIAMNTDISKWFLPWNLIKMHQIVPFLQNFLGEHAPVPPPNKSRL